MDLKNCTIGTVHGKVETAMQGLLLAFTGCESG
jgi:hypothetical protein